VGLAIALVPLVSNADASRAHMLNLEGASLFARGDLAGAESRFRDAVADNPTHAEARNNLGRVLAVQGRSAEAAEEYRIALGADPTQAETYFNLEDLYREAGRLDEAEEILARLETARGGRIDDVAPALDFRRGRLALARGDTARAEPLLRRAVTSRPELSGGWTALADLSIGRGDYPAAVDAGRRAVETGPGSRDAHLVLGRALIAAGSAGEAVPVLERAWRFRPSLPEAPFYLGRAYLAQGDIAQAEGHLRAAVDRGRYVPALLDLGTIYERLNRPRDAAAVYQAVIGQEDAGPAREEALRRFQALQRTSRDGEQ
jgi:tetratricopeptide (TPR) repeat protein